MGVPIMLSGNEVPPLDPSSETAREWVREELARGYQPEPGPWERFLEWLRDLLSPDAAVGGGLPGWVLPLVVAVVIVLGALVVARLVRPEARTRRGVRDRELDLDPAVTAAEYHRRATAALAAGDADAALLDAFRAVTARSTERTLLADLPGRTAREVAEQLAPVFPAHAAELRSAATAFAALRYGAEPTTPEVAGRVIALDDTLSNARPTLPDLTGAAPTSGGR